MAAPTITYKQYTMKLSDHCADKFDLTRTVKRKSKVKGVETGEINEAEDLIGYGLPLDICIKKIAHLSTLKEDTVMELKQFIVEYKKAFEEIKDYLTA